MTKSDKFSFACRDGEERCSLPNARRTGSTYLQKGAVASDIFRPDQAERHRNVPLHTRCRSVPGPCFQYIAAAPINVARFSAGYDASGLVALSMLVDFLLRRNHSRLETGKT